jgi:hypothetical protein
MNPLASAFTPGPTTPPDITSEELRSVNQSLCKALAEARQAHNTTKIALEEEVVKRTKAEEEVKALLKTNSSLASTAQMLGAIVKQNISKPNKTNAHDEAEPVPWPQEMACSQVFITSLGYLIVWILMCHRRRTMAIFYRTSLILCLIRRLEETKFTLHR